MGHPEPRSLLIPRPLAHIFIIIAVLFLLATPPVNAYQLNLEAPWKHLIGTPLVVNGTTSLPTGESIEVIFTRTGDQKGVEIGRENVTIQSNKNFTVTFPTIGLESGHYKLEVPNPDTHRLGGKTLKDVMLISRSGEIYLWSPRTQEFNETFSLSGKVTDARNTNVQVTVITGDTIVFGPGIIKTDRSGTFSIKVPIEDPGKDPKVYQAVFKDADGFIDSISFTITPKESTTILDTTENRDPDQSTTPPTSATAEASRDNPAYFAFSAMEGNVSLSTSSGIDWVIEYWVGNQSPIRVNEEGSNSPEVATLIDANGTISVKVYPYNFSYKGNVTLNATNVKEIEVLSPQPGILPPPSLPIVPIIAVVLIITTGLVILIVWYRQKSQR
jgi:hypothetical protein